MSKIWFKKKIQLKLKIVKNEKKPDFKAYFLVYDNRRGGGLYRGVEPLLFFPI